MKMLRKLRKLLGMLQRELLKLLLE